MTDNGNGKTASWSEEDHYKFLGFTKNDNLSDITGEDSGVLAVFKRNSNTEPDGLPLWAVDELSTVSIDRFNLVSSKVLAERRELVSSFDGVPSLTEKAIQSVERYESDGEFDLGNDFLHEISPESF